VVILNSTPRQLGRAKYQIGDFSGAGDSANSAVDLPVPHFKKTAPFESIRRVRLQAGNQFGHLFCRIG